MTTGFYKRFCNKAPEFQWNSGALLCSIISVSQLPLGLIGVEQAVGFLRQGRFRIRGTAATLAKRWLSVSQYSHPEHGQEDQQDHIHNGKFQKEPSQVCVL